MISSGLYIFSFNIKKKYSRGDKYIYLNPFTIGKITNDFNMVQQILNFMVSHIDVIDDDKLMKLFSIEDKTIVQDETANGMYLTCIIKSGSYGLESDITDRRTSRVVYSRKSDDADIKRFRCLFYIPKNKANFVAKKGIAIFQSLGNYGVKSITLKCLKSYFSKQELTLESWCLSISDFFKKLLEQNNLNKITYIKNYISSDDTDNLYVTCGREEKTYRNPRLKEGLIQKLLAAIKKQEEGNEGLIEIDDEQFIDIKVTFNIGKKQRTVSLSTVDKFSIVEEIPEEILRTSRADERIIINYMLDTVGTYAEHINMYEEIKE